MSPETVTIVEMNARQYAAWEAIQACSPEMLKRLQWVTERPDQHPLSYADWLALGTLAKHILAAQVKP